VKKPLLAVLVLLVAAVAVVGLGRLVRERAAQQAAEQFYLGQSFLDKNDDESARQAFLTLVDRSARSEHVPAALEYLAEISERAADFDQALGYWQQLRDRFAATDRLAKTRYHIGYCLEHLGRHEEAREAYLAAPQGPPYSVLSRCGLGRIEEAAGHLVEAREIYRRAVAASAAGTPEYSEAVSLLGAVNIRLLFSRANTPESILYTVRSGDSVSSVGAKFNVTQASIVRANDLQGAVPLRVNRTLKITPVEYRIVIDKSEFVLRLYAEDQLFKEYSVGIGRPEFPTTAGKYVIENKMVDPVWYSPEGKVYPGGDPENELGSRWMGLRPLEPDLPTDLGIHSTIHPDTIGWASSRGCPRLLPADAEELFDIIPLRTPVLIED